MDIFCGTKSMQKVALQRGYPCTTIDNDTQHNPDILGDVMHLDITPCWYVHFSPPCDAFSVASIGRHWTGGHRQYIPKTDKAKQSILLLQRIAQLIKTNKYTYWTVENPRGMMRKLFPAILKQQGIKEFRCVTITYCQYGDTRMKPTDFFTNIKNWDGKRCKNGMSCHTPAPRGSKTGTQGLKNKVLRGVIPPLVFHEIFDSIEKR